MRPGVQSKQQHRVFLEREKGLLELFSTRKAKKLLKGGTTEDGADSRVKNELELDVETMASSPRRRDVVFMITRAPTASPCRDGAVPTQAQGKLTVAVAAGMAVRRERKDAENVLRREQREHQACKPAIGRASFLRDVRIAEVRYGTPEARQAHKDGREANDMRSEASRLRREVLDLGGS